MKTVNVIRKEFHLTEEEVYKMVQEYLIKHASSPDFELIDRTNVRYNMRVDPNDPDAMIVFSSEEYPNNFPPGYN